MKRLIFSILSILLFAGISCNGQPNEKPSSTASIGNVEVYYFHFSARCMTCKTVEAEARKNVEMLYANQLKDGKISFTSLNLEEETGRVLGEKLGVSGQTLLIVKGDQKFNITNEGFLYAVPQPEKFRAAIKEKVDALIN